MKKYFIFAAVAAAGLFASCSSSDDVLSQEPNPGTGVDNGLVPIEIGVGSPASEIATRGTGTAGDVASGTNIWRGERVRVLMYELDDNKLPTFEATMSDGANPAALYDNATLVTPLAEENTNNGIAKEPSNAAQIGDGATYKVKYYPSDGNKQSDFWGYYLGGYGTGDDQPAGDATIKFYEDAALATETQTAADATVAATHFVIDGTHDLLVGQAAPADPAATDGHQYSYSAKAARQGIQPNIVFKHLLSRLQFKVKPGKPSAAGVEVKSIKVRSKQTGDVIVAYKYKDANGLVDFDANTDGTQNEPERIIWDATEAQTAYDALPELSLKRRITQADIDADQALPTAQQIGLTNDDKDKMKALAPVKLTWSGGTAATYDWVASDEAAYDAATTNKTDVETNATTIADAIAAYTVDADANNVGDFVRFYKNNDGVAGYQAGTGNANDDEIVGYAVSTETPATGGAAVATQVGEALLVAPQAKYFIEVDYQMDKKTARNWYQGYPTDLTPGDLTGDDDLIPGILTGDLVRTATETGTSNPKAFAAGESYLITITLYGPEEIVINTTLTAWDESDQDIELGKD